MATALSMDLRQRVLSAIKAGASCRQAARRFGVSAASAIRWHTLQRLKGHVRPQPQGGDRRSYGIEAHSRIILNTLEKRRDITLAELRVVLAQQGLSFGQTTLWRFFHRHRISLKKRPRMRPSRIVRT